MKVYKNNHNELTAEADAQQYHGEHSHFNLNGCSLNLDNQLQMILYYLRNNISTATMISVATGIPQKNICRYKKKLEKAGLVEEVERGECEVTGRMAWYLSVCI